MKTLIVTTNVARRFDHGDELEQRVIISADGHAYFTAISLNEGQEVLNRKEEFQIDPADAMELIDQTIETFSGKQWSMMPKLGTFNVVSIADDGRVENYYGSLSGVHTALSDHFKTVLAIPNLYLFG
jgi:hypothetical protein